MVTQSICVSRVVFGGSQNISKPKLSALKTINFGIFNSFNKLDWLPISCSKNVCHHPKMLRKTGLEGHHASLLMVKTQFAYWDLESIFAEYLHSKRILCESNRRLQKYLSILLKTFCEV